MKLRRLAPGLYETTHEGVTYEIHRITAPHNSKTYWFAKAKGGEAHDWHDTKREAVEALREELGLPR